METVIPPEKKGSHVIEKYRFKVLSQETEENPEEGGVRPYRFGELASDDGEAGDVAIDSFEEEAADAEPRREESGESGPPDGVNVEELFKRIDELSTELVKTQMLLEKQEAEFDERLRSTREEGYREGVEAGQSGCAEEVEKELAAYRERLAAAIGTLEESRNLFLSKVDSIEEELIETALDLARQVVVKEIEHDSKEVALRLARLLLAEVKEAAKVTVRVNPGDFDHLRQNLEEKSGVELVADPAVAPGGVVIQSDVGNIDGEIMHRFERIKEAVFGTVK